MGKCVGGEWLGMNAISRFPGYHVYDITFFHETIVKELPTDRFTYLLWKKYFLSKLQYKLY